MSNNQRAAEDLLADLNDLPDNPDALPVESGDADEASINEFLAEFSTERERTSRPITPRLPGSKARNSPRPSNADASRSSRSQDVARTSTDSRRSNKDGSQTFTNSSVADSEKSEKSDETESVRSEARSEAAHSHEQKKVYGSGTSWSAWGGSLWSTANNLQSQIRAEAEKRIADLQASEEAQRIQARLRELDLSKIASEARNIGKGVLDAVAPPIEDNETLIVHVLHDLTGLRVERTIYNSFERVMEQVEGGSLHIVASDREGSLDTNAISGGPKDARKMSLAAIEDQIRDVKDEEIERTSKIYLSLQAYGGSIDASDKGKEKEVEPESVEDAEIQILMTLVDPANQITFSSTSQSFPSSWIPLSLQTVEAATQPREWINEWLEEALQLTAGVLAQRYVARRMGIDNAGKENAMKGSEESGGMKIKEGQDLSEAGLGL